MLVAFPIRLYLGSVLIVFLCFDFYKNSLAICEIKDNDNNRINFLYSISFTFIWYSFFKFLFKLCAVSCIFL